MQRGTMNQYCEKYVICLLSSLPLFCRSYYRLLYIVRRRHLKSVRYPSTSFKLHPTVLYRVDYLWIHQKWRFPPKFVVPTTIWWIPVLLLAVRVQIYQQFLSYSYILEFVVNSKKW